jgi:hypothetical protein
MCQVSLDRYFRLKAAATLAVADPKFVGTDKLNRSAIAAAFVKVNLGTRRVSARLSRF